MDSSNEFGEVGTVSEHLTALDAAVAGLLDDQLSQLSDADVAATLQQIETSLRKASTLGHRLVVESVERGLPGKYDCKSINNFLIKTLRLSVGDASRRVTAARKVGTWHSLGGDPLPADLPATAAAQRDGAVGPDHVDAIRQVLRKVPRAVDAEKVDAAEQVLAELARSSTPDAVAVAGQQLLGYLNPDGSLTDDRDRKRQRSFRIGRQNADLMTPVSGLLDPEARALLEPVLAKYARPGMNNPDDPTSPTGDADSPTMDRDTLVKAAGRDTRTAGQRNHDALKAGLRHVLASGILGSHRGLPVTAIITMTLKQLEEATGVTTTASGGMLPIRDALRMAEFAHPVLCIFDHSGRPLHLGRNKRLASADQRLALIAASRGCTRPGCDAPASMTAVHHVKGWKSNHTKGPDDGGATDIENLDLACDPCHALIHDGPGGWQTANTPDGGRYRGRTHWIAPPHIDPDRSPRVNHRHHLDELLAKALARSRARREAELKGGRRSRGAGPRTGRDDGTSPNDDGVP